MAESPDAFPPTEESIARLRRSGWSTDEAAWTGSSGRIVYQVDGTNGENSLLVRASTQREAWHRAVEAAAACGMLADWPRPSNGAG
jgi:hypothetical protein